MASDLSSPGAGAISWANEGAGSQHKREFVQFLNIARRSLFEDASMLLVFEKLGLVNSGEIDPLLTDCDPLSRKITNFARTL
ncbi:MAG: four helix bundle protein [Acidobacteriota bacterium]